MLSVTKEIKNGKTVLVFSGTIDENDDLEKIVGPQKMSFVVRSKELKRINSVGVKNWIKYFSGIQAQGLEFSFEEASAAITEQLNIVKNFGCGGKVVSIMAHHRCASCEHTFAIPMGASTIVDRGFKIPNAKCPKCARDAEFDDIPEDCFSFLK